MAMKLQNHDPTFSTVLGALTGLAFGTALYKSQVYRPEIIQAQMLMENFTMLKTFVAALISGTIVFTALESLGLTKISAITPTWNRNILGGALLGAGIYLAGACPGTVFAQLGAGVSQAPFIFLGGLLGAFTFGYFSSTLTKMAMFKENPAQKPTLHEYLGVPRVLVAAPLVLVCTLFLWILESYVPWQRDSGVSFSTTSLSTLSLSAPVWSPYIAGAIIGLLQLPNQFLLGHSLGTSSTFTNLVSSFASCTAEFPSSSHFGQNKIQIQGAKNLWQPILVAGIIAAAFLNQVMLGNATAVSVVPNPLKAMFFGFLLIFGARFANGCTSGHGISGCAKLNIGSLFATAAMFGSGILVATIFRVL